MNDKIIKSVNVIVSTIVSTLIIAGLGTIYLNTFLYGYLSGVLYIVIVGEILKGRTV